MTRHRVAVFAALALSYGAAGGSAPASASHSPAPDLEHEQWALDRIDAQEAWDTATGAGTVIAVIDSGVGDHSEFAGKVHGASASWWDCPEGTEVLPCTDPGAFTRIGHGTWVSGIAVAARDGHGTTGVAPGARLMVLRVIDEDGLNDPQGYLLVPDAIRWAVDHGADVINLSLGLPEPAGNAAGHLFGWIAAIDYAAAHDVLVVAAAGNYYTPVCINEYLVGGELICVGAVNGDDTRRLDSNWGAGVDVVAPGGSNGDGEACTSVLTTDTPHTQNEFCPHIHGDYDFFGQTSAAAPHVAAVAALLAECGVTGAAAGQRIIATADDVGPVAGWDPETAHGRVNARSAVVGSSSECPE